MKSGSRLVERYVARSVLPYVGLALLLLTAVLLAQQINRFSELLGATRAPVSLAFEVLSALLPGILIFTLPMAMLAGSVIGLSRMGSDSELVALRAAGVGTGKILTPLLLIGTIFSVVTLYFGLESAPLAAQNLRRVAFRAALSRLESPVEPGTFNTEIPGKIIYVRDGNEEDGRWGRIFISTSQENGARLIITARSGRIDSTNLPTNLTANEGNETNDHEEEEQAELVLSDAAVTTLPTGQSDSGSAQVITERLSEMRVRLDAPNRLLLQQMRSRNREPEELRWSELVARAQNAREALVRTTAATTLHKKLALGASPLVFALLAVGLGLRVRRGGRGIGVLLSILVMICYYLLSLGGEQAARAGVLAPYIGAWLATVVTVVFAIGLLFNENLNIVARLIAREPRIRLGSGGEQTGSRHSGSRRRVRFWVPALSGLMDRGLVRAVGWNFCGAWIALVSIFLLFTLFELGRFLTTSASTTLIARYLFYLLPMVGVALAPVSLLVAVLAAYAVMARRREAVAWWACGQSVYRLALPSVACAMGVSVGMWFVQEKIMPIANRRQDALRAQIKGGGQAQASVPQGQHQQWLAAENRIFSYEFDNQAEQLRNVSVYEFDASGVHLQRITSGQRASVNEQGELSVINCEVYYLGDQRMREYLNRSGGVAREPKHDPQVVTISHTASGLSAFKLLLIKPSHLKTDELSDYIIALKRRREFHLLAPYVVALERRRADLIAPLVMALIGLPMALAFGRQSAVTALCAAIVVGLLFWAVTGGAQQMALYGQLPPVVAAWFPPVIFLAIGIYLLARART